jgi:hypothetical protein
MPDLLLLEQLKRVAAQRQAEDASLDMSVFWHPCGSFGCLAGWAARDPFFAALGLKVLQGAYGGNTQGVLLWERRKDGVPYHLSSFKALEALFGLDEFQACYLFGNNPDNFGVENVIDWEDAIERIEEVIRGDV